MSTLTEFASVEDQAGTSLKNATSLEDVIERAGFDFEVEKAALYNEGNAELDGFYALRRADTKEVTNRYTTDRCSNPLIRWSGTSEPHMRMLV